MENVVDYVAGEWFIGTADTSFKNLVAYVPLAKFGLVDPWHGNVSESP